MLDIANVTMASEKRKLLLILLHDGPQSWEEIKKKLNVTATGMLPQIKILEEEGLIVRWGKICELTHLGKIIVHHLIPFYTTLNAIESQKKFWQEHDIGALPDEFLLRIGEVKNIRIIETGVEESFEPYNPVLDTIYHSTQVAGISPVIHPVHANFFHSLARGGQRVNLILTKNAFDKIGKEYYQMFLSALQHENAHLWICEKNIMFDYIVTDIGFSMRLFLKNGIIDTKRDIFSSDPSAIRWAEDLFTYYIKQSRPVSKEGLF
jgi:predicted transcriptional regulator